jgi:uncharacterized protein YdaU (DUF1376 family)
MYYDTEKPIPADTQWVARRIRIAVDVVNLVLSDFFTKTEDGWRSSRCDREIASYHAKAETARANGKKGGRKKTNQEPTGNPAGSKPEPNGNQDPAGSQANQELEPEPTIEPNGSVDKVDRLPVCNRQAVVDLYHEILPELPQVRVMNDSRGKVISSRWKWILTSKKSDGTRRAETAEEALTWLRQFFELAKQNDFLMGRSFRSQGHQSWQADIDFLMTDRGLKQVVEKTGGAQ